MEHGLIRRFDVGAWLQQATKSRHLVGREVGRQCRAAIEQQLSTSALESVTTIDCTGVDHLDVTAADACVVKLIRRVQAFDYDDLFVTLAGLSPTQEENVGWALERNRLAALVQRQDGPEILGDLNPYLRRAWAFVKTQGMSTARQLADAMDQDQDQISLASTTLLNLYKARLVVREFKRIERGGGQYVYRVVEGSLEGRS